MACAYLVGQQRVSPGRNWEPLDYQVILKPHRYCATSRCRNLRYLLHIASVLGTSTKTKYLKLHLTAQILYHTKKLQVYFCLA